MESVFSSLKDDTTLLFTVMKDLIQSRAGGGLKRPDKIELQSSQLYWQVMKIVCMTMGFRCATSGWGDKDLIYKETLPTNQ